MCAAPSYRPDETPEPGYEPLAVLDAPPERVGLLLAEARTRCGLSLTDVTGALDGRVDPAVLMALEAGVVELAPDLFDRLGQLYEISAADLVPPRDQLVVDLNEGYLRAGPDMSLLTDGVGRRAVLDRYLEMVWEMRGIDPGTPVPLRDDDLEVLSASLGGPATELERSLRDLMAAPRPKRSRGALIGLGAAIAVVTGGALMWMADAEVTPQGTPTAVTAAVATTVTAAPSTTVELPPRPSAEIGDAMVLERGTGADGGAVVRDGADLPPAPTAEVGDAAVLERAPDGSEGVQTTR